MKNYKILKSFFIILIYLVYINSLCFAYNPVDTESNGGEMDGEYDAICVDGVGLVGKRSGITYTVQLGNGEIYNMSLDAGDPGYGNLKGYASTGYDDLDGENRIPAEGIDIELDDIIGLLEERGYFEAANSIKEGRAGDSITAYAVPYLCIGTSSWGEIERVPTVEALKYYDPADLKDENSFSNNLYVSLTKGVHLLSEESDNYLQMEESAGGKSGWAGYQFEAPKPTPTPTTPTPTPTTPTPTPTTPTPTPTTPTPTPTTPTPTPTTPTPTPTTPTPTPTTPPPPPPPPTPTTPPTPSTATPTPTPVVKEELPPPSNRYTVKEGYAGVKNSYLTNVKIDNKFFEVFQGFYSNGNPIPTNEKLTLTGCTSLVGAIKNLGLNTVTFTPWVYTVSANWSREEERSEMREVLDENGDVVLDEYGDIVYEEYTYKVTVSGTEYADTPLISGTTSYYKIRNNTNWGTTRTLTVTNASFGSYTFNAPRSINYYPILISEYNRIIEKSVVLSGYETAEEALEAAKLYADNASWSDFWEVRTDILNSDIGVITYNGTVSDNACNLLKEGNVTTLEVKNNSINNNSYPSAGEHEIEWIRYSGKERGWNFRPNSIRIHTPIYNELVITSPSSNQLVDESISTGDKIVTLDEKFTVTVNLNGLSKYYTSKTTSLAKYVKSVTIECGVCERKIAGYTHTCTVPVTKEDNKKYTIKSTVVAKNIWSGGQIANNAINEPDGIYVLTQTRDVYIAGKIYDLEVRAVDDPTWKLRVAENLAKLPIGEQKDNAILAYKYGIKLGYRAYFDLKTLGVASQSIRIIPKIYYVTEEGEIKENVALYYKTSKTDYKKLSEDDITISMKMTATKGDVNNENFKRELVLTKISEKYKGIDSSKTITIGGLSEIYLTRLNSTITKYNNREYIGDLCDVSRRWHGEIYVPASTIVVDTSVIPNDMDFSEVVKKIESGKGVLKTGYLMITFENIISLDENSEDYLNYEILRDSDGIKISPDIPSILVEEKGAKEEIILPNGEMINNLPEDFKSEDAPIIIYDVSLKANDDYETSGTH